MKPALKPLLVSASLAAGIAVFAVACGDRSPLPVSPSTVSVSGVDGSAAKGTKNFCGYLRAHEADDIYLVGQPVTLSLYSDGHDGVTEVSSAPHGNVCFSIPPGTESVYLSITKAGYCTMDTVEYAVHGGPSYIWLLPSNHDCSYNDEPY